MKKLISIDFDGVLNDYSGSYEANKVPKIRDGAQKFIEKLSEDYRIEIFTARNQDIVLKWLEFNKLNKYIENVSNVKNQYASVILDDRAINFDGDFDSSYEKIVNFQPYWKK